MEWIRQRADRVVLDEATPPRERPLAEPR
jgi:hypothetical protein